MSNFYITIDEREIGLGVSLTAGHAVVRVLVEGAEAQNIDFAAVHSDPQTGEGLYSLIVEGKSYQLYVTPGKPMTGVAISRHRISLEVRSEREWRLAKIAPKDTVHTGKTTVRAPMPGLIKAILVEPGDEVKIGTRLLVLEAMKMENDIVSPRDGSVSEIFSRAGDIVEGGKGLLDIE